MRLFFLFTFGAIIFAHNAFADCTNPAAIAGTIEYSADNSEFIYCDGSVWNFLADGARGAAATELNDLSDAKYIGESVYVGSGAGNAVTVTTILYNTALGYQSLYSNTTGGGNTAIGRRALHSNTTGEGNTAIGRTALHSNTTGEGNTANGPASLYSNTTGSNNTSIGPGALYSNTTGSLNTGIGHRAGRYITDGTTANATSNNSLYLGASTKALADGGDNEIVIGYNATGLGSNSVVLGNDSIATTALKGKVGIGTTLPSVPLEVYKNGGVTSTLDVLQKWKLVSTGNVSAGFGVVNQFLLDNSAGDAMLAADFGAIWADATAGSEKGDFIIRTRNNASTVEKVRVTSSGYVGIGTKTPSAELHVVGDVYYTGIMQDISDRRLKTDIQELSSEASKISELKPVSFKMKDNLKRTEYGFIAQELAKVYPDLVQTADDVSHTMSVNYVGLIAPLVKSFQELNEKVEKLTIENMQMRAKLEELQR